MQSPFSLFPEFMLKVTGIVLAAWEETLFYFFKGHSYPIGTISIYFLHLASVHRKPGIANPFTLQNFLFCDNA